MAMVKTKADQLLCCVLITFLVSGIRAAPAERDQAPEDLIAVVKVGKKYYSNEPLTEDGRGVLYPVPDRLLGSLGLPKPGTSAKTGGFLEGQEMKLSLSETRRQPQPYTATRAPERGYMYKKPDPPFRYPDEPQDFEPEKIPPSAPRQRQPAQDLIDSNELSDDDLFRDRGQETVTSTDKSAAAPQPLLNQHDIRAGTNSGQRFVAKDIPTFDSILKGAGVVDDLREGDEFTGFQSRPSTSTRSGTNSKLGTQSQLFNANIRELLYHRGKNGNGVEDGSSDRGPIATRAPIASAEFDQFALFVPSNEVQINNRHLGSSGSTASASSTTTTEREPDSPSTTSRFRPSSSTRTTTESEHYLDVRTIDDDNDPDVDDDQSIEVRAEQGKGQEEGYGFRMRTQRPRTKQRTRTSKTTTTTEPADLNSDPEEPPKLDNELEQLESPVEAAPEELKQIVTTITTTHVPAGPAPTLHVAPTFDLTAQEVPTHMNDIMRQIYAPIQQQLPFIPMFDSIQPSVYLPFMPAPVQPQPQLLMQMLAVPLPPTAGGEEHANAVREALFARQAQALQQVERPATIEDLYARGNGIVYNRDLVNEAPINALRAQDYEFSRGAQANANAMAPSQFIGESVRAETYSSPAARPHHHQKGPNFSQTQSIEVGSDFRLPHSPKMEMFTPADAMTRRPPTFATGAVTTSREYPNTHY